VKSVLATVNLGGADVVVGGMGGRLLFQCEIGLVLSKLTHDEFDAVEAYYWFYQGHENAEALRAAAYNGKLRMIRNSQEQANEQKSSRYWGNKANEYQRELGRISTTRAFKSGIDHLSLGLQGVLRTMKHVEPPY
jgi:hypothetical protein